MVRLPTPSAGGRTEASSTQRSPGLDARGTERQHAHARDREVAVDSPSSPPRRRRVWASGEVGGSPARSPQEAKSNGQRADRREASVDPER